MQACLKGEKCSLAAFATRGCSPKCSDFEPRPASYDKRGCIHWPDPGSSELSEDALCLRAEFIAKGCGPGVCAHFNERP